MLKKVLVLLCSVPSGVVALDFESLRVAFESPAGVTLRVADPGERVRKEPTSTTVWRSDLPLALFSPLLVGQVAGDVAGIIFEPGRSKVMCGYPINANTVSRVSAEDGFKKDVCGRIIGDLFDPGRLGGACNFSKPEEYASAYLYKPMYTIPGSPPMWTLGYSTCHFKSVVDTLDAQKALLSSMMHVPPGMTKEESVGNGTKVGFGITAFNEVMVAPYETTAVGGIFWAHPGRFRAPNARDTQACAVAKYLKSVKGRNPLPIFELSGVNLERPFLGCNTSASLDDPSHAYPTVDCLSKGLDEWQQNLTKSTGREASRVFRHIDDTEFLQLFDSGACGPGTVIV